MSEELSVNSQEEGQSIEVTTMQKNRDMMNKIANDQQTLGDIKMLTSPKVTDQLKVFLVSQARRELARVVKLIDFLDKLESNYMTKVDEAMTNDELSLKEYSDTISVITSLLARSNEIISSVLKDDSLMTILNTTIYTSSAGTSQTTSIVSQLSDGPSRERVRSVIKQIMVKVDEVSEVPPTNEVVVEGDVTNE